MTARVADLARLTRAEVAALRWDVRPEPVIGPPFPSPVVADPTFLPPESTPDHRWHLWAHSLVGLHHWTSTDGDGWRRDGTVVRNALRAHVVDLVEPGVASDRPGRPDRYRLAYERTRLFLPLGLPWRSWIESRRSADLTSWTRPTVLLRPSQPWHRGRGRLGEAVSNPCLVPLPDGSWRLYFSAGLVLLPDCGFAEPEHIGVAHARTPDGPFVADAEPLLSPAAGDLADLAAGAIKVVAVADGWLGFQNAISWDAAAERSASVIRLLGSTDGLAWEPLGDGPILAPTGSGWMASHVYALDVRATPDGPRLYFNARSAAHWTRGREAIGYAVPRAE